VHFQEAVAHLILQHYQEWRVRYILQTRVQLYYWAVGALWRKTGCAQIYT